MQKKVLLYKVVPKSSYKVGEILDLTIQERVDSFHRNIKFMNTSKESFTSNLTDIKIINFDDYLLLPEKDFITNSDKKRYKGTVLAVEDTVIIENFEQLIIEIH